MWYQSSTEPPDFIHILNLSSGLHTPTNILTQRGFVPCLNGPFAMGVSASSRLSSKLLYFNDRTSQIIHTSLILHVPLQTIVSR